MVDSEFFFTPTVGDGNFRGEQVTTEEIFWELRVGDAEFPIDVSADFSAEDDMGTKLLVLRIEISHRD